MNELGISLFNVNTLDRKSKWWKFLIQKSVGSEFIHMAPYIGPYQLELTPLHPSRWVSRKAIHKLDHYTHWVDVPLLTETNLTFKDFDSPTWAGLESRVFKMLLHYNTKHPVFFSHDCFQLSRRFAQQFYPNRLAEEWNPGKFADDLIQLGESQ